MRARLERWLLARWYGRPGWLWLLWPLEGLFRLVVLLRGRPSRGASPPVIVVGNLSVGGSGKTPLVAWLARRLQARGVAVGIVSRGYGGSGPFPCPVSADTPAAVAGDEAVLLARRTGVPVVVAPDRRAGLALLAQAGVTVVIGDDGLQSRSLPRTVEIAVVDAARGHGNGHCLPVGPLREPVSRLASVDFVVSNGGAADADWPMRLRPTGLRRVSDPGQAMSVEAFLARHGARVSALAGIGHPARFFNTLRDCGFAPDEYPFPDHHAFVPADLALPGPLVMTEKDAVKCAAFAGDDAWYLEIEAELPPGFLPALLHRAGLEEQA